MILRPAAKAGLASILEEKGSKDRRLEVKFLARVTDVLERIEQMPESYAPIWEDVRGAPNRRFQHVVFCFLQPERIEVLGIFHGARDPSSWMTRR